MSISALLMLKLGELNEIHLTLLEDYLMQKHQIIEQYPDILDKNISPEPKWVGVLVGSSIHPELAAKINNGHTTKCGVWSTNCRTFNSKVQMVAFTS